MRRLLGMAFLGLTPLVVVLIAGSTLVPVRGAEADPEAPVGAPTPGSLTRYQARLESEAAQVFETTVTDPLRRPLSNKGVALWATSSVGDWSRMVTEAAPSLASVVDSLALRSRVLWREERVIDAYDSLLLQLATVHAMQRGLFRIVDGTGRPSAPAAPPAAPAPFFTPVPPAPAAPVIPSVLPEPRSTAPTARPVPAPAPAPTPRLDPSLDYAVNTPAPSPTAAVARPVARSAGPLPYAAAPARTAPPSTDARPPAPRVESKSSGGFKPTGRGPVWPPTLTAPPGLRDYQSALDRETYRILTPEIEGGMQDALAARKASMRAAPTVAAWKAELTAASPTLSKAGAVLERRTEVLRGETRVVDTMESDAVQRAAVGGLQAGLERILAQFGR